MTKKILTVIGARPQIIKSAAVTRAISNSFSGKLSEVVVHTGQHYDKAMSDVFFTEMGIPVPAYNLAAGSASHAVQTASMLSGLDKILSEEKPDVVLTYGDTNSTLAAALAASKSGFPVAHVEAGLRSFNKNMPEEVNRILTDHVSSILFAPTQQAIENLRREGFRIENEAPHHIDNPQVVLCGDVMLDNAMYYRAHSKRNTNVLLRLKLDAPFFLATIHRDSNTDHPQRLTEILSALEEICESTGKKMLLPLHPRTLKMIQQEQLFHLKKQLTESKYIIIADPVSYLEMIELLEAAEMVFTDSGGVQKEAFFFHKPCVILRPQTEWVELVINGNAIVADTNRDRILRAHAQLTAKSDFTWPSFYGDGKSAEVICQHLLNLAQC